MDADGASCLAIQACLLEASTDLVIEDSIGKAWAGRWSSEQKTRMDSGSLRIAGRQQLAYVDACRQVRISRTPLQKAMQPELKPCKHKKYVEVADLRGGRTWIQSSQDGRQPPA